jgi:hypothetical protein
VNRADDRVCTGFISAKRITIEVRKSGFFDRTVVLVDERLDRDEFEVRFRHGCVWQRANGSWAVTVLCQRASVCGADARAHAAR